MASGSSRNASSGQYSVQVDGLAPVSSQDSTCGNASGINTIVTIINMKLRLAPYPMFPLPRLVIHATNGAPATNASNANAILTCGFISTARKNPITIAGITMKFPIKAKTLN